MRPSTGITFTLAAVVAAAVLLPDAALAAGNIFGTLSTKGTDLFTNGRLLLFIGAGLGILGLAGMGFFGHWNWRWAFSLVGAIIVLAAGGGIILYASNSQVGGGGATDAATLQATDTLQ
ncbi:hypothetical protein [Microvirga tunisiensis]|uniref:TrbC/VirB2 family protein n=1 Tax=Microvirga tunisiensis TaxID=2108360 RepID=A0A5N7ML61_9HYPH|nr:hypothetical protein [Microvirga tunisiensis]MPR09535.1 hypothetical protein [Microvirga tunisiensis]MPR27755.1 hypothetical protein [Microvirga tunisiensis]